MSILIKGMEMPTRCEDCPCMCEFDTVYQVACGCKLTMKIRKIDNDTLPNWCPLVPVPPHGRLIDADRVRNDIDEKRPGRSYEDAWALTIIDAAPTIIPAEPGEEETT